MEFKVPYLKENKIRTAEPHLTTFRGEIGARMDRFFYQRLSGAFAVKEILGEAEKCFEEQYDDEFTWGMWRGEFWGKQMLSCVRACRMKPDKDFREELRRSAYRMLSMQREDGYLSTYRKSDNILSADPAIAMKEIGWGCYYNWNIWGQKYTLWGMIECAMLCDDEQILAGAEKMALCLLDTLDRLGLSVRETGVMEGMPPCSILKPMLLLYRLTGNKRFLSLADSIVSDWQREDNARPNLVKMGASGIAPHHWFMEEDGTTWYAKAYEMMSCFDGLCEYYRVTGCEAALAAAQGVYELLKEHESNILGGVGYCEQFADAALYPDSATEVCDVLHWMRLCWELYAITGEPKYMESFENAFLNAFLAGIYEDGKWGAFFVRSSGRHWTADPQVETKYQHCCVNNAARGFCNAAESVFVTDTDGALYVNSYIPARAVFGETDLKNGNGYLDNGSVGITIRGLKAGQKLYLRMPEWSKKTVVTIGDTVLEGVPGTYLSVPTKEGDMVIRLRFDMTPRVIDFVHEFPNPPAADYHVQRWTDPNRGPCDRNAMVKHPMSILRRGALLYARSKRIGAVEEEMFSGKTICGKNAVVTAAATRHDFMLSACNVTVTVDGETVTFPMCDFASAANKHLDDARYFTVFI